MLRLSSNMGTKSESINEVVVGVGKEEKGAYALFLSVSGEGDSREVVDKYESTLKTLSSKGKAEVDPGYTTPGDGYQLIIGGFKDIDTMKDAVQETFGNGDGINMIDLYSEEKIKPSDLIKEAQKLLNMEKNR